jgi:hypothetical protein
MLSQPQFNEMADTTKIGAMPIKPKFDGAAPINTPEPNGEMTPNKGVAVAKPGFF